MHYSYTRPKQILHWRATYEWRTSVAVAPKQEQHSTSEKPGPPSDPFFYPYIMIPLAD
jgi:hypothetical protein